MAQRRTPRRDNQQIARNRDYMLGDLSDEELERLRSRRKKRSGGTVMSALIFIAILGLCGGLFGGKLAERYAPSTERKDLNEWFEVSGDEARIYLNDTLDRETNASCAYGAVYFPIKWVQETLNERFYWQADDGELIYTLPDEVVHYTEADRASDGAPVYELTSDGDMLLNLTVISEYTDIRSDLFTDAGEAAKRVFLYTDWSDAEARMAKRDVKLRTKGGIKSPILTDAAKGTDLKVLETMDSWSKVLSPDGVIGFVQNKYLDEVHPVQYTSTFEAPRYAHTTLPEKVVLGWHMVFGKTAAAQTLEEYAANTGGVMNVICPTGIQISDAEGGYENFIDESYVEKAHELGLKVWVMIDNFNQPGGLKDFSTKDYFAHAANRQDFIDRLMTDADAYGYDGYNLDFEGLAADAGPSFVQFYRELSVAMRKRGLVLSIDNYVPYQFNDHYELSEQADYADYVVIMGYDEHTSGSAEAGSVASIGYTRYGIEETLKEVSAEYVVNGVPFFTRVWKSSGPNLSSDAMGITEAKEYVSAQGIELSWDEECGQYYGIQESSTGSREIWMEEERSIAEKVKLIRENELGGVAAWRLGYEPAGIWKELDLNG